MDGEEDEIREHKLHKARQHAKEMEDKYHHLHKEYDCLLREIEELRGLRITISSLEDKLHHMTDECRMWEEKFHKMEHKHHTSIETIMIHTKRIKELEL